MTGGDSFIARAVVCFLGTIAVLGMIAIAVIVHRVVIALDGGRPVDIGQAGLLLAVLGGPVTTAIGSLGSILARTGAAPDPVSQMPQPVRVVNEAKDAVPVEETAGS